MSVIIKSGSTTALAGVGLAVSSPVHASLKPIDTASLGHYKVCSRVNLVNLQAANSRIFELRVTHATNLIILTRLRIYWHQTGAHTAAIEDSIDTFKVTGFTAVDTVNTVTPSAASKRTTMAAPPGGVALRFATEAGAAAGMTGGTLTKDSLIGSRPLWLLAAQPTAQNPTIEQYEEFGDPGVSGGYPFTFVLNEGIIIENRVLLGAAASSIVTIELGWAETTLF